MKLSREDSKIAVIYPSAIHAPEGGEAAMLRGFSKMQTKRGYNLTAFSVSSESSEMTEGFKEVISKSVYKVPEKRYQGSSDYKKYLEYATKDFLRRRASANAEPSFREQLNSYKPDIILTSNFFLPTSVDLLDTIIEYKNHNEKKPKLIFLTDDFKAVEEFFMLTRRKFFENLKVRNIKISYSDAKREENRYICNFESIYMCMMNNADAVVLYTDTDLNASMKRYSASIQEKLIRIQPSFELPYGKIRVRETLSSAVFFGNSDNLVNADAKQTIIEDIAPNAKGIMFVIAGPNGKEFVNDNIISIGNIDPKILMPKSDIFINPQEFGTGVQTKLLPPLRVGLPILSTYVGAQGYPAENNRNMILENDIHEFPRRISELSNKDIRERLANNAREDMAKYFSYDTVGRIWDGLLERLLRA